MKTLFIFCAAVLLFSSCEKVIDLKLSSSEPRYVIKAEVNAGDSIHFVRIQKSIAFDEANIFPSVSDAEVVLKNGAGQEEVLSSIGNGIYRTSNFLALEEESYSFKITHQGEVFEASCTIPKTVQLDDVVATENEFFGQKSFVLTPLFQDPGEVKNFYGFVYSKLTEDIDKQETTDLILRDDEFSNGQYNQQPLFGAYAPQAGDTVEVLMIGLAEEVYNFYFSKETNTSSDSGAPANPVSNWTNGALGYFTAQNVQKKSIIIPK